MGVDSGSLQTLQPLFEEAARAYRDGDRSRAAVLAQQVLAQRAEHAGALFLLGVCAFERHRADEALPHLEAAARLDGGNPNIQRALGLAQLEARHWQAAVDSFEKALPACPDDTRILNGLGIALTELGHVERALQYYHAAARLDPGDAYVYNNIAIAEDLRRDSNAAIAAYQQSLRLDPANVSVWANLAALLEQANRLEEAEAAISNGLAREPRHAGLHLTAAKCAGRRGDRVAAVARLERLLTADIGVTIRRSAEFELGRVYDRLGETDAAFRHFQSANDLTFEALPGSAAAAHAYRAELDGLRNYLAAAGGGSLFPSNRAQLSGDSRRVAFLLGFPRSGTTLLDTFVGGHPQVTVLEEEPCLEAALNRLRQLQPPYPEALQRQDAQKWEMLRSIYWQAVAEHAPQYQPTGLLLDKSPLMTMHAGFIHALLPQARFVLALRHPCDVVLSCFMQSFGGTPAVASFLDLETAADTYRRVMDLWLRYREACDLEVHELRYEDLLHDTSATLQALFGFLGLDWQPASSDHVAYARERGRTYTPSYAQIIEPLNTRAINRWQRYAGHFGPVLEQLRPYAERFGYTV